MKRISKIILAASVGALAATCDHGGGAKLSPEARPEVRDARPALIKQRASADRAELAALGGGKLVMREGCWRKEDRDGSRLLLWPPDVSLAADGRGVVDDSTGVTVREGDDLVISGGEIDGLNANGLEDPIPPSCKGPYWLAGSGFFPAPREDWRTIRIGSDYSIHAPADLQVDRPAAALPLALRRDGLSIRIESGAEPCPDAETAGGKHLHSQVYSDQRLAIVTRVRTSGRERLDAVFHGVDGPRGAPPKGDRCLRVSAECSLSRDCDVVRSMISTIRFGDLGTPD